MELSIHRVGIKTAVVEPDLLRSVSPLCNRGRLLLSSDRFFKHGFDRLFHEACMWKNTNARRSNQPHDGADRRRQKGQWQRNNQQSRVQLRRCNGTDRQDQVFTLQSVDHHETPNHQDNDKQQEGVRDERIDRQEHDDRNVVRLVVMQVIADTLLQLTEVGWLGEVADIEEFLWWTQGWKLALEWPEILSHVFQTQLFRDIA